MQTARSSSPATTRQRLLDAAARVYARDGLAGATTRAIAIEAGVNEVTLFRHFQTKDGLLAAVVGENFGPAPSAQEPLPAPTHDLRADLLALAERYEKLLNDNLPLVRTMLGEIHHHNREHEKQIFKAVFRPLKVAIVSRMQAAIKAGAFRADIQADLLADLFGAMLFTGVLRCSNRDVKLEYSPATHLAAVVDLVLRGAAPETHPATSAPAKKGRA